MTLRLDLPEMPATDLVTLLGNPHRAFRAYTRLLALGPEATEAARGGLAHPDERVREQCCKVLDHLMDADSIPLLVGALADPCERVRITAVHALACDWCRTDACRPSPEAALPPAIDCCRRPVRSCPRVRGRARRPLGARPAGRARGDCRAAAQDPVPSVRKKESWYAPSGTDYERTVPPRPVPGAASLRPLTVRRREPRHERGRWSVRFRIGC